MIIAIRIINKKIFYILVKNIIYFIQIFVFNKLIIKINIIGST